MTLSECIVGKEYKIDSVESLCQDLIQRLESMGIYEGNVFMLQHTSTMKNTFSLVISGTHVALRRDEAKLIHVSEI